jgi:hypothetical protein
MANVTTSYVDTPILGEMHGPTVRKMLSATGLDFALPEDCAKAAMRIAADPSINGKHLFAMVGSVTKIFIRRSCSCDCAKTDGTKRVRRS